MVVVVDSVAAAGDVGVASEMAIAVAVAVAVAVAIANGHSCCCGWSCRQPPKKLLDYHHWITTLAFPLVAADALAVPVPVGCTVKRSE